MAAGTNMKKIKYKFYSVTFPNKLTADMAADFWNTVAATFDSSSLLPDYQEVVIAEARADVTGISHRIGTPWQHTALIDKLRSHIPGINVDEASIKSQPDWSQAVELGVSDSTRLLDTHHIEAVARSVLTAMGHDVKKGDHIALQLVVNPVGYQPGPSEHKPEVSSHPTAWALIRGSLADRHEVQERRDKASENQFKVILRIVTASSTPTRAAWLMKNVHASFKELNGRNTYLTDKGRRFLPAAGKIDRFNAAKPPLIYPAQVNVSELMAMSAWPIGGPLIAGLTLGKTRYLPPNEMILKDGRRLGLSYQDRPVAISPVNACRHMYVIGPSGLGKTTLLANSLLQDIERGDGVVVIESKGDLFRAALNAVPKERVNDVIVMDLTDEAWPVGLNVMHGGNINRRVDELTRLFSRGDSDIYFRDLMYHGLHTLARFPELTIVDLVAFLWPQDPMTKAWRDGLIDRLPKSDMLYRYWKTFAGLKDSERKQRVQPVLNRLWEVTNRPDVANILGQSESTIDLREVMAENKLLFIYIPDSIGAETVSLLTSLLFKELWDAVRDVQAIKKKPTFLYLDEMQRLTGYVNLPEVLSLARSFKFGMVMAHQNRDQLTKELQSAITNAATKVSFRLEGPDANWMQSLMGKAVTAEDFMSLDKHEVIAQVATEGGASAPTWFRTLPQFDPHGRAREVVESSRAQYSRSAERVNQSILSRRSAPVEPTKAKPSFGRMAKEDE